MGPRQSPTKGLPPPLHMVSLGEGNPPIVLVHGFGAHGHFWRRWSPVLSRRHRIHVVDLPPFGASPAPFSEDYSPEAHAGRIAALVQNLEGPPPVLVGHSLGAGIVLLAVLRLIDEQGSAPLGGLVLVSAAAYPQRLPPFLALAQRRWLGRLLLLVSPPAWALRRGIRGIVGRSAAVDDELVEGYGAPLRDPARRRATLRAARQVDVAAAHRLAGRLGEIRLPTLLIWGGEDPVVPVELGRRLARDLEEAELVVLPGVGHLPPEEDPERSVGAVLRFLESLSRRDPGSAPAAG